MGRLERGMTIREAIAIMADGNCGADVACADLITVTAKTGIPRAGVAALQLLDEMGIYGSELYGLWDSVCKRNAFSVMAVLVAFCMQVQGVTLNTIRYAIRNWGVGLDIPSIIEATQISEIRALIFVADRPVFINSPAEG